MKKSYFLWVLLMLVVSVSTGRAQTYKLKDLTSDQFAAGGDQYWSFERHDVTAGVYAPFTTYGNNSTAVNFYDSYITTRFNFFPIMNKPESGNQYDPKRNAWFSSPGEYLYVAEEYPVGTTVGTNLAYGTTYPDSLMGYEVYSLSTGKNAAITFTVPADGYYRADMKVLREDLWNSIGEMKVYQFIRLGGSGTAYSLGKEFNYGKSQGVDFAQASNAAIYNQILPQIPENPIIMSGGRATRGLPTYSKSDFIYFYAKAGDKISFEADARSTNNTETSARGAYARTKWLNLAVSVTDEATASASDRFTNPYYSDPKMLAKLDSVLAVAQDVIDDTQYPLFARNTLGDLYISISQRLADNAVMAMEVPALVDQVSAAIEVCKAAKGGLKVRYTFDHVDGNTVTDESGLNNNGTLNNASVITMGKYHAMDLGSNNGYLDMGAALGVVVSTMSDYTISAYYRISPEALLSGNGFFLWVFSTLPLNNGSNGQYIYYQLQKQRFALASAGWNTEKATGVAPITPATKGAWQHVVYTQSAGEGKLYVNGVVVAQNVSMPAPNTKFTTAPSNNWIGKPCFGGDNYLQKTFVTDFRLYNYAIPTDSISEWAARTQVYEDAMTIGEAGDFTALKTLIANCKTGVSSASIGTEVGKFRQTAVDSLNASIAIAQTMVDENKATQFVIDARKQLLAIDYDIFMASRIAAVNTLTEGNYYIQVNDTSYLTNPGTSVIGNGAAPSVANGGMISTLKKDSTQSFKLSFVNALTPPRYSIFSNNNEAGVFRHFTESGVYQATWGPVDNDWRTYNIYYNGIKYAVRLAGAAGSTYWMWDTATKKLVKGSTLPQYIFNFIPAPTSGIKDINAGGVKMISANHAIRVISENKASVSVFNLSGMQIAKVSVLGSLTIPLKSGLYIVKVDGATSVVSKIMVK